MTREAKKTYYNPTRILARFRCILSFQEYKREINLISDSHATREAALVHVRRQLEAWAVERGNDQHETVLELLSWTEYPTE